MLNAQKVYYIGLPTTVDNRNIEDFDNCRQCLDELGDPQVREQRNATLGIDTPPMSEECPECMPKRSTETVYIAVSQAHPLISEFYVHPQGIMATIRGVNSLFYMSLEQFLHKFRKYVEILPDDDKFEDQLKSKLNGDERQSTLVEQILPDFVHDNWGETTRREQQLMGLVAINAIDVMDEGIRAIKEQLQSNEKRDQGTGSDGNGGGSTELQTDASSDVQEG